MDRVTERRTIRRVAEEAMSDPRLGLPAKFTPGETQSDALPPGFAGRPVRDNYADAENNGYVNDFRPHPMSRPTSTQLMFRLRPTPWYRTKAAKLVVAVLALAAAVTGIVILLWPTSTPAPTDSTPATSQAPAPSPSPTATPSASLRPSATPEVIAPPPPPPPPPPPSQSAPPPAAPPRYYPQPRYNPPPPSVKPEIGVTRAPISVKPTVKPPPAFEKPKPGEASRGGGFW